MADFFSDALNDVEKLEEELLGPDYAYYEQILSPSELGMSAKGSTDALKADFKGLTGYVDVLLFGGGDAQKNKHNPLGDKFFLTTGAKCKDTASGETVTRSLYINNVPDGSIPFISTDALGGGGLPKGLVPGTLSNLARINPMSIFAAFMSGTTPDCQSIKMELVDDTNQVTTGNGFVTNTDIQSMPACWFLDKTNPVTSARCEGFTNMNPSPIMPNPDMPDDALIKIYYSALGLLGIYILFKLFEKKK